MRDGMHETVNTPARPWARTRTLSGARVLAFDIDNTIVDLVTTKKRAIRATLDRLEREGLPGDLRTLSKRMLAHGLAHGLDANDLVPTFFEAIGVKDDRLARRGQRLLERFEPGMVKLFPGAIHTLDMLRDRGYRLYAITDATQGAVNRRLPSNGLTGRFDGILTREDTLNGKNDPAPFERVLKKEHIPAKALVGIGDDPVRDVTHPIELGGQGILAAYGHGSIDNHSEASKPPTATIGSLPELLNLLTPLGQRTQTPLAFA